MIEIIQDFHIPENIVKYLKENDGVNLAVNWNSAGADYGYAHTIWHNVVITKLTRTCQRCGYDPLWKPDDTNSKCLRHSFGEWRYDVIFSWSQEGNDESLEECFDEWMKYQPKKWYDPAIKVLFGRYSYR